VAERLIESFADEDVEDGLTHPAEELLREGLRADFESLTSWIEDLLRGRGDSALVAPIVKCLGRLSPGEVSSWGLRIMSESLRHRDIEVRDAAIHALALWSTPEALDVLRRHRDPVPWLEEYVALILKEAEDRG